MTSIKIHNITVDKKSLCRWKVYFDRSRMYIGYIQFILIGIVFLRSFENSTWGKMIFDYAYISIPIGSILFIFLSLLLGYFDTKLGVMEEEYRNISKANPIMMETLNQIKELNKKIEDLNKR